MAHPPLGGVLAAMDSALAAAIAAALETTARGLAADVEATELTMVRLDPAPGIIDTFQKFKLQAELVSVACALFKEIAAHPDTPVTAAAFPTVYGVPGVTKP